MTLSALPGAEPFAEDLQQKLARALKAKGEGYEPRTHHLRPDGSPEYTNRLILETSPYLIQHAHNPVSWFPWGEEAFVLAEKLGRPILLSVGYSTCHWCHVMERESFEDPEIAAFINAHFIAIKVDREERPDVDSVYMTAVQMMTHQGGWPMTVVMTPAREPFFGGTYFPARDGDRGARVGFLSILRELDRAYREEKNEVVRTAGQISRALKDAAAPVPREGVPDASTLLDAARFLEMRFDRNEGGFGGAPKFPRPSTYDLLLRTWRRSKHQPNLHAVTHSLRKMQDGGIYDQIGGGFHRYSTDGHWLVPHFEKMLYDNAQLVLTYLEAFQASGDESFEHTVRETLDYVAREMTSPEGGFYSATDADSEGHEGLFFVWTPAELETTLGKEAAAIISAYYDVSARGNFEGKNILHRPRSIEEVAKSLGKSPEAVSAAIAAAKPKLYAAREKRIHPLLDDKILTEWNGQMISAFARAGLVLDSKPYVERAERAANFILENMESKGRLSRAHREGQSKHLGMLEDYAFLANGLVDLFEASANPKWLEASIRITDAMIAHFEDPATGGFFGTPNDGEALLVREKPSYDGAQPSGNSVAALVLLRLYELTERAAYRTSAEKTFLALGDGLLHGAPGAPKLACALDFFYDEPKQIVLVSPKGAAPTELLEAVRETFLPNAVLVRVEEEEVAERVALIPLLEGKRALDGRPTAYVCTHGVCEKPTHDPKTLKAQLSEIHPLSR